MIDAVITTNLAARQSRGADVWGRLWPGDKVLGGYSQGWPRRVEEAERVSGLLRKLVLCEGGK